MAEPRLRHFLPTFTSLRSCRSPVPHAAPFAARGETGPAGAVAAPEAFREVGTAGRPAFESGWANFGPGLYDTAAFYKDPLGVVHLKGTVMGAGVSSIFTLPVGYRPAKSQFFAIVAGNSFGDVLVRGLTEAGAAGKVQFNTGSPSFASLDGITFANVDRVCGVHGHSDHKPSTPDVLIARLAARQHGVVSQPQLLSGIASEGD